uniref:Uncharacterized protein n=1 Tax=viral metagenome TaxID=1070528 RepID=A0A6M3XYR8_9ZZZZ
MKLHIQITDEKAKKAIQEISKKQDWSLNKLGKIAILFYLRARKLIK